MSSRSRSPSWRRPSAPPLVLRPSPPPESGEVAKPSLSFEAVYDQQVDFVWRSARRLGVDPAHLEDVVQEVFLTVHRKLAEFEGRSALRTWLYGITLHVVRNHRRGRRRKPLDVSEAAAIAIENAPDSDRRRPDAVAERRERDLLLDDLLAQMPDPLREVLVMAELEGLSGPEMASLTGLKVATVYGRLRNAREKFNAIVACHPLAPRRTS
ncbi:MAG: RNA polymerase sigma factor [Polyangiaceae bacterium]